MASTYLVLALGLTIVAPSTALLPSPSTVATTASVTSTSTDHRDLTLTLRDIWWQEHGPDRAIGAPSSAAPSSAAPSGADPNGGQGSNVAARPTMPGAHPTWSYPSGAHVERTCSERICVHHVERGAHASTAAWAGRTLRHMETAWRRLVDDLGFRAPAEDGDTGGDARFDVYLANVSRTGQFGFCSPDAMVPGQSRRTSAYCVLDNDMSFFPGRPDDNLAVTAAHELFHAIQFNLDVAEDTWFMEATATWGERQVFPGLTANRNYLRGGQLGAPHRPLDSQAGMYGNWIFVHSLAQKYGRRSIQQIWHRLDASTGRANEWSLQGIARYISSRGDTWSKAYRRFAVANAFPARHRGLDRLGRFRPRTPDARVRLGLRKGRQQQRWRMRLDHLTSGTAVVTVRPPARGRRVEVLLRTGRTERTEATLVLQRRDGTRTTRSLTPGRNGRAMVRFNSGRVRRAVVVVANTSRAYRRCGEASGWACGGQPKHDGTVVRLRTRLLR